MKNKALGFGIIQIVVVAALLAVVALVAVPKYEYYVEKAKLTEAVSLGGDARKKLNEYYSLNGRFPRSDDEADAMLPQTVNPPEYVSKVVINHKSKQHAIVAEVYLKKGVITNTGTGDQYIYMAADKSSQSGAQIEWTCGAVGIDPDLLPERCRDN